MCVRVALAIFLLALHLPDVTLRGVAVVHTVPTCPHGLSSCACRCGVCSLGKGIMNDKHAVAIAEALKSNSTLQNLK